MYQRIVVVRLFLVRPREIRRAFAPQRPIVRAPIRRRGGGGARRRPRARARREGARREDADGVAHRRARRRSRGRHRARAVYRTRAARGGVRTRHRVAKWRFAFFFAARTTRAPRRRCACSTRWIGSNARPENNTSNSIVTTCLRVRLSRRAPSHGRRELRFAQANRFRCHFYEFICTYVSDSALEIYYLRWRQSNRLVVAARTHIC